MSGLYKTLNFKSRRENWQREGRTWEKGVWQRDPQAGKLPIKVITRTKKPTFLFLSSSITLHACRSPTRRLSPPPISGGTPGSCPGSSQEEAFCLPQSFSLPLPPDTICFAGFLRRKQPCDSSLSPARLEDYGNIFCAVTRASKRPSLWPLED